MTITDIISSLFERPRLNPMNDVLIKYLFFEEERKHLTISLINAFFSREGTHPIVDFTFLDREPDPDDPESIQPRLDLLGKCADGTVVEIEFQCTYFPFMAERVLFYWSRMFQKHRKGLPYGKLPRIAGLNILGYKMFPELSTYHNCFMVMHTKEQKYAFTNKLELHFAEIPKWEESRPRTADMDQLSRWLAFLSTLTTSDELKELAMNDTMIRTAVEAEARFCDNVELMSAYDWAEKSMLDKQAREDYLINKGKEEGIEEGILGEKLETAKRLLAENCSLDLVQKATNLTIDQIKSCVR